MSYPITHTCGVVHMWNFKKILESSKPYHYLRVEDAKTLTLDSYRAILNIGPLGREGVPLFSIVIVS
jgi:hypothetical protein